MTAEQAILQFTLAFLLCAPVGWGIGWAFDPKRLLWVLVDFALGTRRINREVDSLLAVIVASGLRPSGAGGKD